MASGEPTEQITPEGFVAKDRLGVHMGARFVSLNDGVCVYDYEANDAHFNPGGMLHGGALYVVMDSSQGMLVYSLVKAPEIAATGTATIKYLAPVRRGRIVVTTTLAKREGRKLFIHSEATDEQGTAVAVLDEVWIVMRA
jgi:uncharacterized protein (TIGR00369 family)